MLPEKLQDNRISHECSSTPPTVQLFLCSHTRYWRDSVHTAVKLETALWSDPFHVKFRLEQWGKCAGVSCNLSLVPSTVVREISIPQVSCEQKRAFHWTQFPCYLRVSMVSRRCPSHFQRFPWKNCLAFQAWKKRAFEPFGALNGWRTPCREVSNVLRTRQLLIYIYISFLISLSWLLSSKVSKVLKMTVCCICFIIFYQVRHIFNSRNLSTSKNEKSFLQILLHGRSIFTEKSVDFWSSLTIPEK